MTQGPRKTDESEDTLFQGAIRVNQHLKGNRFALDTLLLAGALRLDRRDRILDLGSGNGALALAIWHLHRPAEIVGIEIQAAQVDLAQRNVMANSLEGSIRFIQGDVRQIRALIPDQRYAAVVMNPPYYPLRSGRLNPDGERAASRHELHGALADFIEAAGVVLSPRGKLWVTLPTFRLPDLLHGLSANGLAPAWLQGVQPRANAPAKRVLLQATRGTSSSLILRPPLVVQEGDRSSGTLLALLSGHLTRYPGEGETR